MPPERLAALAADPRVRFVAADRLLQFDLAASSGQVLPSGDYLLKLLAYPIGGGSPTVRTVSFRIK